MSSPPPITGRPVRVGVVGLGQIAELVLPAYLARVPFYREVSERFLGLAPAALAEWLVAELARAGAVVVADGVVRPTMAA